MTQREIPDVCVKLTATEVIEAEYHAICSVAGRAPSAEELCCHVAQSALETGWWKFCHCNNLGNCKASESYKGLVTFFGCNEVLGGKVEWFHPAPSHNWPAHNAWTLAHPQSRANDNQCRWQAFESLNDGAIAQMRFFQRRPRSYKAAQTGNPNTFAYALKADRYYTAPVEDQYANGKLVRGYAWILGSVFGKLLPACRSAVANLSAESIPVLPEQAHLPPAYDPDVDVLRAAKLDRDHIDAVLASLRDLVVEIPWGDCNAERKAAVLALNET